MACLLLNTESDLSDPRVEVFRDRAVAAAASCLTPHRLSWIIERETDLLLRPDAPELARDTKLGARDLARIYNAFAGSPVKRFQDRQTGARRTAALLAEKFLTNDGRKCKAMDEMQNHEETVKTSSGLPSGFAPQVGDRVTILESDACPEEHGVITEVNGDEYTIEADPLYRMHASDDGSRIAYRHELAPDPLGEVRRAEVDQVPEPAPKPASRPRKDDAALAAEKAEREAAKARKAAEREAAKAKRATDRDAAKAARIAEREAAKAKRAEKPAGEPSTRSGKPPVPRAEYKVLRGGTIREQIVTRMDGTRTAKQIAEEIGKTASNTSSHIYCLWRDCGIGFEYDPEGRVRVLPPEGMTPADLFQKEAA